MWRILYIMNIVSHHNQIELLQAKGMNSTTLSRKIDRLTPFAGDMHAGAVKEFNTDEVPVQKSVPRRLYVTLVNETGKTSCLRGAMPRPVRRAPTAEPGTPEVKAFVGRWRPGNRGWIRHPSIRIPNGCDPR